MKFKIPKTPEFEKYRAEEERHNIKIVYDSIESLKHRLTSRIDTPDRSNNRPMILKYSIRILFQSLTYRIIALSDGGIVSWNENNPLMAIIASRTISETVAMAWFTYWETKSLVEKGKIRKAEELIMGFSLHQGMMSSRLNLRKIPSTSSMLDSIDKHYLHRKEKIIRSLYDTLSEICHPNWLGVMDFYSRLERDYCDFNAVKGKSPAKFSLIMFAYALIPVFEIIYDDSINLSTEKKI